MEALLLLIPATSALSCYSCFSRDRIPGSAEAGSEPSCEDPFSAKYAQAEHHRLEDCRVIIPTQLPQPKESGVTQARMGSRMPLGRRGKREVERDPVDLEPGSLMNALTSMLDWGIHPEGNLTDEMSDGGDMTTELPDSRGRENL